MTALLPPDSLVGSWLVRERMGNGSHGTVLRVVHKDRPHADSYALKLALRAGDERFEREAHLLSCLSHPSVPRFEERGTWRSPEGEAHPYVVMQWVEGLGLYAWALEHGLSLRQAIRPLAQVARALEATHVRGVHRDVKGGNIRVSAEGRAVLLDFGSCWYPEASPLTGNQMPPGTNNYRSPQLLFYGYVLNKGWEGSYEAEAADDLYALGVTAYRLLAGVYPPSDPRGVRTPRGLNEVCPELGELIARLLSEFPEQRGSVSEAAEELEALLEYARPALDEPWGAEASRRPPRKAGPAVPPESTPREEAPPAAPAVQGAPPPPAAPVSPAAPRESLPRVAPSALVEAAPGLGAGGVLVLLVLLGVVLARSTGQGSMPSATESPDAGPSGVGEEALSSVRQTETPPVAGESITREIPREPFPDQKLPPCTQQRVAVINGGCWRLQGLGADRAPCDSDLYEHDGRCYSPVLLNAKRVPTSKEPQ